MESDNKNWTAGNALKIVLVLIISLALAMLFIKTRPHPQKKIKEKSAPLVTVAEAHKTSHHMIIQAYGTVRSGENLTLAAEVKGKIVETAPEFEEGISFAKGAFLMRIDPRDYRLNVERLNSEIGRIDKESARISQERENQQASLKIAEEDLRLARAESDRYLSLRDQKVVSQTKLDQTRQRWLTSRQRAQDVENFLALINPRIELLQAQRRSAMVQLEEAQLDLDRTQIRAPFDCRVEKKMVERGQFVAAGKELADIFNIGVMEVEVRIPLTETTWLPFDSRAASGIKNSSPVMARIIFNAPGQNLTWNGFVARIKGRLEESTRTLPVVIQIRGPDTGRDYPIMPGMFVSVEIAGKQVDELFLLPRESVHKDNTVYVVKNEKIQIRSVDILRRIGNQVYVKKGLSDGDMVVTLFSGVAIEGMRVRTGDNRGRQEITR